MKPTAQQVQQVVMAVQLRIKGATDGEIQKHFEGEDCTMAIRQAMLKGLIYKSNGLWKAAFKNHG